MQIKSSKYFRENYMTEVRHVKPNTGTDPDFMGSQHEASDGSFVKGFFDLYHGYKPDIGGFLSGNLKIAEDGQAIYEFMQNAADCDSTAFYMFYNDNYFLAVNNGRPFSQVGLRSLLNVGQSPKKSASFIGRFGIGFKLVHRLVGKSDGNYELLNENKGPILFSWSRKSDLLSMMNKEDITLVDDIADDSLLPYFNKILLTNFPSSPNEVVKDLNYNDNVVFTDDEYAEMASQVKIWMEKYLDDDTFQCGSLFFIKLGEGKRSLLDKDYKENLKIGIEYSLNTLKYLKNIKINDTQIDEVTLKLESSVIPKDSDDFKRISPEYKDSDIHFTIGYNQIDFSQENPFVGVEALKKSPTFYKYFPMGDEIHQSAIFIHCDSLSNEANRRKLQEDSTNKELIPIIAQFINDRLKSLQEAGNIEDFQQIYANLLLSEHPHDNSNWLKTTYYDKINDYLKTCVPTSDGAFVECNHAYIRAIKCDIPLSLLGDSYRWFAWNNSTNLKPLVSAAKDRLKLKEYNLVNLLVDADIKVLNQWIVDADEQTYEAFLNELSGCFISSAAMLKIRDLKLFRFSDGNHYSYSEIITEKQCSYYPYKEYVYDEIKPIIFTNNKIDGISDILKQLGFVVSERNIDAYEKILACFQLPKDTHVFNLINKHSSNNSLSIEQNKALFLHLTTSDVSKKFEGVGDASLKNLCFFKTEGGKFMPLGSMIGRSYDSQSWLSAYRICEEDYFSELDKYFTPKAAIYATIIHPNWDNIRPMTDLTTFYKEVRTYYSMDTSNKTMSDKEFVYAEDGTFHKSADIVFNANMLDSSIRYQSIKNVVSTIFGKAIPDKQIASELQQEPFLVPNTQLCSLTPSFNEVASDDICNFIKLCKLNREAFFNTFIIEKNEEGYRIISKSQTKKQVYATQLIVKDFIEKYCSDIMVLLPSELSEFSDELGIVKGDSLYDLILSSLKDIESLREELINVLKYDSKRDFILKLSSVEIDLDKSISLDDFEYKIIDAACSSLDNKDYDSFRSKIVIKKEGVSYNYDQLPSSLKNDVIVDGAKIAFNIDKLLPNEYANAALLTAVVEKFAALGLNDKILNAIFGLSSEADLDQIYNTVQSNYAVLENAQQLAFVRLMIDKYNKPSFDYKLSTLGEVATGTGFVINGLPFIDKTHILAIQYAEIGKYLSLPYMESQFIQEPYITEAGAFISPEITTRNNETEYNQESIFSFLNFLLRLRGRNVDLFKKVDWSKYSEKLSFNPKKSVCPRQYATLTEQLPDAISAWVGSNEAHLDLLSDMGLQNASQPAIRLRKYMLGQINEFDLHTIYGIANLETLENTIRWINSNCSLPLDKERYDALKVVIEQINKLRQDQSPITIADSVNFEELYDESIQYAEDGYKQWSEASERKIFLFDGEMPHQVMISEYIDSVVYSYYEGNVLDDSESTIYVNRNADIQKSLHLLAANNNIGLTPESVYKLFNKNISDLRYEIEQLRKENALLKGGELTAQSDFVDMRGSNPNDVDVYERPEYNEVARKKVKKRLESEGYIFTQGVGDYSIVPGVFDPEGVLSPLVVKSCKSGQLFISPIEWEALLRPNSMLWIFDGYDVAALPLRNLIRNQEKLVLSMDTRNLDDVEKVSKFAQILRYFKQVNFEFNSVRPTTIASTYKQYAFNDRNLDEKPEADDFE